MPESAAARLVAFAAVVVAASAAPVLAQTPAAASGAPLTVVRCDPQSNSCEPPGRSLALPTLGPAGQATVLSPNRRTTELSLDSDDYDVLIPGCTPVSAGVFVCESRYQYQHCRTLMFSSMVYSCLAANPLADGFAEGRPAARGDYSVAVESNARVRVTRGDRGFGQARGEADVVLTIDPPRDVAGGSCLQRDRFLFYPTGPEGGVSDIDDTAACDAPMEFSLRPHEDDIVRAYDACEEFSAWGGELEESIEIVAAGLFHMQSDDPGFLARYQSGVALLAIYVTVAAPLKIDCAD